MLMTENNKWCLETGAQNIFEIRKQNFSDGQIRWIVRRGYIDRRYENILRDCEPEQIFKTEEEALAHVRKFNNDHD
jgi:hypothetical protein